MVDVIGRSSRAFLGGSPWGSLDPSVQAQGGSPGGHGHSAMYREAGSANGTFAVAPPSGNAAIATMR